jgi:hypothetical protein
LFDTKRGVSTYPEALRNGLVDMVFTTDGYYTSVLPELNALSLTKIKPWEERANGVNDLLNKGHAEKLNSFYLGRMGSTSLAFTNTFDPDP